MRLNIGYGRTMKSFGKWLTGARYSICIDWYSDNEGMLSRRMSRCLSLSFLTSVRACFFWSFRAWSSCPLSGSGRVAIWGILNYYLWSNKEEYKKVACLRNAFFGNKLLPRLGFYRIDGIESKISAKSRDMTKGLYWFERVIEAAQMLHTTAPTRLHQIVEHLPITFVRGTKKSGPKARPATAADIYKGFRQSSRADIVTLIKLRRRNLPSKTSRLAFCGRVCSEFQKPAGWPADSLSRRRRQDIWLPKQYISCAEASSGPKSVISILDT